MSRKIKKTLPAHDASRSHWLPGFKRALTICDEIQKGERLTTESLAALLGMTSRTVKRDLRALREEFGAPIRYERHGRGFYFADNWQLGRTYFSQEEET